MKNKLICLSSLLLLCAIVFATLPFPSAMALELPFPDLFVSAGNAKTQGPILSEEARKYLSLLDVEPILKEYRAIAGNDRPSKIYLDIVKDYKKYLHLVGMIEAELNRGAEQAASAIGPECGVQVRINLPSWKYFASVLRVARSVDSFLSMLRPVVSVQKEADGKSTLLCTVEFEELCALADRLADGDGSAYLSIRLTYIYLNTVYNEKGKSIRYVLPSVSRDMLDTLVFPLESYTKLRKSWYYSRDCGCRKHTGMDIHAKEGTHILSCTDGIVEYIGYEAIPGNYVVIRHEGGYEYHYYHLVKLPDFLEQGQSVKAGDLVGLVGNTGNSSVDHLHISILSPNDVYINPYTLMLSALKRSPAQKESKHK